MSASPLFLYFCLLACFCFGSSADVLAKGDVAVALKSANAARAEEAARVEIKHAPPLGLTVPQALQRFSGPARQALKAKFKQAGANYPPAKITLIGLKQEKILCLFAGSGAVAEKPRLIATYPLVAFSGKSGPKLRQGDLQIPEGIYKITGLAASFRLALTVGYPNYFDKLHASHDHRTKLGGDILIHNGVRSTGCLVVSMEDMAQVFTAANDVGCRNVSLVIAPCNFARSKPEVNFADQPEWLPELYSTLKNTLAKYLPGQTN